MKNQILEKKLSKRYNNIPTSFVRSILNTAGKKDVISFAGGLPNPEFFPIEQISESARSVLQQSGALILQYAGSLGYYPLREWIAQRYQNKYNMNITPEMVVITNGSQQALDILAKLLVNKHDSVILEKPSYLGAIQAFSAYQPNFCEVDLENDGANLNQVEAAFQRHNVKLMYAVPNAQNPSGITYSEEKRFGLAQLLKKHQQFLVEDDPYNEINFYEEFPAPIKKLVPNHVAWTGSFSKMIAPGLRNGWVVLPPELVPHFDKAKQSTDLNPNNLTQYTLHHFLENNNIDAHLARIKMKYAQQCEFMLEMIQMHLPDEISATTPTGGMFIWLSLPADIDSVELVNRTLSRGVVFVPGESFYTNGQGAQNIRMNFTNASFADMEKGIKIIGEEMHKMKKRSVAMV